MLIVCLHSVQAALRQNRQTGLFGLDAGIDRSGSASSEDGRLFSDPFEFLVADRR